MFREIKDAVSGGRSPYANQVAVSCELRAGMRELPLAKVALLAHEHFFLRREDLLPDKDLVVRNSYDECAIDNDNVRGH